VFLFHGPSLQVLYLISLPQVLFSFLYTYYYLSAVYEFDFFLFNWIDGHSELYTLLLDKVHVCTTFCVLNFLGSRFINVSWNLELMLAFISCSTNFLNFSCWAEKLRSTLLVIFMFVHDCLFSCPLSEVDEGCV
jgi:hypothetical protein